MNNERRDFLKLLSLFTLAGSSPFLQAQEQQRKINHNAPLKIGYLPITDATPLLVAHAQGLFEKYNVEVKKPIMFRSWAQLIEAFFKWQCKFNSRSFANEFMDKIWLKSTSESRDVEPSRWFRFNCSP
ncbi:ABC transporter substrate-binding protein [Glaesserella parasuis]|nr:ABC transporter substrate-binding protein [Glaesserella parasuis]MDP0247448.1 ABC transporter substrate-binding protein [Glaesserella parasuis]